MNLVTVFQAFNPLEAEVIRSRLEASNFHAVVTHDLAAMSIGGYSLATGGVLVQVPDDEAAGALELIKAGESGTDQSSR